MWEMTEMEKKDYLISELTHQLDNIKKVTPKSFRRLTKEQKASNYYLASCKCGWWGCSELLLGGGPIADTGDYDDCCCPFCYNNDIDDK